MVKPAQQLAPLDQKLLRDLWRMKGQGLAIALVVALGVLMLVMMDGLFNSLTETKRAYYERYRLAHIFVPLVRAPNSVLEDIQKLPGISAVEGRVTGGALIDLPEVSVPIHSQGISIADSGKLKLNDIYLTDGRQLDPTHEDEIILLNSFAQAHDLAPGDSLKATMNGARRTFKIVGLAQSPEFLYAAPRGEMMPDDARFSVIWMSEKALAAAFDLDGAFNEVLVALARDADSIVVQKQLDTILNPYGGLGAYPQEDHASDVFVQQEIDGLEISGKTVPPVFLAVAAFLLNIVISRMIEAEREQIGLLKAFGYTSYEIGGHYFKFIMVIAILGAVLGCFFGVLAGRAMVNTYLLFYKFPFLVFEIDPRAFMLAFAISILAASAGGLWVLRKVFVLTPAIAMRPQAPADYSKAVNFSGWMKKVFDQPTRMVLRRLIRQPVRTLLAVLGIATGMSLSVAMIGVMGGFDKAMDTSFNIIDRSDVTVTLVEPLADKTLYELAQLPGVIQVEGFRQVSATFRNGVYDHRGAVTGFIHQPKLNQPIDKNYQGIYMRDDGLVIAQALANKLHLQPGDKLTIEVREGRRPVLELPVVGITETLMGSPVFLQIDQLNRALKEPGRVNGAYLRIDQNYSEQIYQTLKDKPGVAGVSLKEQARIAFQKMMDSGAGAMRYVMALMAGIITFGIVYNSARIAFAERARDLGSLRVIGFSRSEAAYVLLAELALVVLLALPLGCLMGLQMAQGIAQGFSTDLYQIPATVGPDSYGIAMLAVLSAAIISGWLVKKDIDKIDIVAALKTRE